MEMQKLHNAIQALRDVPLGTVMDASELDEFLQSHGLMPQDAMDTDQRQRQRARANRALRDQEFRDYRAKRVDKANARVLRVKKRGSAHGGVTQFVLSPLVDMNASISIGPRRVGATAKGAAAALRRQRLIAQEGDLSPEEAGILREIEQELAIARRHMEASEVHASEQYTRLSKRIERRRLEQRRAMQRETRRLTLEARSALRLVPDEEERQRGLTAVSELGNLAD
jgi:hypothetical protein